MAETRDDPKTIAFLEGLALVLTDLQKGGTRDPETMMLIGSLADRIARNAGEKDWTTVKLGLSETDHQYMVSTFARQIDETRAEGKIKIAYALQALATSLVGSRIDDERVTSGIEILDQAIASSRDFFIQNAPKPN